MNDGRERRRKKKKATKYRPTNSVTHTHNHTQYTLLVTYCDGAPNNVQSFSAVVGVG